MAYILYINDELYNMYKVFFQPYIVFGGLNYWGYRH